MSRFAAVTDACYWFLRRCLPRYVRGAAQYGNRNEKRSALLVTEEAQEEAADLLFYLRRVELQLLPRDGRLIIYTAGPYRAATPEGVQANIARAAQYAGAILRRGHTPLCPHTMTAGYDYPDVPPAVYLATDLDLLRKCHAIFLLPGWEDSFGSRAELREAQALGLVVFRDLADLPSPETVALALQFGGWKALAKRLQRCAANTSPVTTRTPQARL